MFTEMSTSGLVPGDNAWLVSEHLPATNEGCLYFWYHMFGRGKVSHRTCSVKHRNILSVEKKFMMQSFKSYLYQDICTILEKEGLKISYIVSDFFTCQVIFLEQWPTSTQTSRYLFSIEETSQNSIS